MDYTYVSDSVLLKMKNQEQNQESSPRKTFFFSFLHFGLLFCGMMGVWGFVEVSLVGFFEKEEVRIKGYFFSSMAR